MKRLLLALLVLVAGVGGVFVYNAAAREREYRRLIAHGDAALSDDQTFVAIEAFSGAITLKSDSMLAYLKRGETYRRRGDLVAALRDLRTATQLDTTATRPLEQQGDINYAMGRYARAAESYVAYTKLDDRSPRVLYKLGLARYRDGNAATAVEPLRKAVAINDRFPEAHYLLGLSLRDSGQLDAALAALLHAVQIAPALIDAREALADLYRSLGKIDEEIGQLEALAALDRERPERQATLGLAYSRAKRTNMAILTLGSVVERHPERPQLYAALGRVWLEAAETRGDRVALSKAIEALQTTMAAGAPTSEAQTLLGRAFRLSGDLEAAERILRQASTTMPVDPSVFSHLADVAQRRGHIDVARDALVSEHALTVDRMDTAARVAHEGRIGDLSIRLNEPAVAARWFRRAYNTTPADVVLLARLADAELRLGDTQAARATIARGLEKEPTNPTLLTLQRRAR